MAKNLAFDDTESWEELHGLSDHDCQRVKKLHGVYQLARLWVVVNDLDVHLVAECAVAQEPDGGEDDGNYNHDGV